jgi:hypothetical protein
MELNHDISSRGAPALKLCPLHHVLRRLAPRIKKPGVSTNVPQFRSITESIAIGLLLFSYSGKPR